MAFDVPTAPIGSKITRDHVGPDQRVFVGVIARIAPRVETPEEVRDGVREAARCIPIAQLGTHDTSTSRDVAFAKIRVRLVGAAMASSVFAAG